MDLNELSKTTHEYVKNQGFWDNPRGIPALLSLITSEVSEVLEEHRKGKLPNETYYSGKAKRSFGYNASAIITAFTTEKDHYILIGRKNIKCSKPEGIPSELADIILRVCDFAGYYGIDLEAIITEKMKYNHTREHMHGGKKC